MSWLQVPFEAMSGSPSDRTENANRESDGRQQYTPLFPGNDDSVQHYRPSLQVLILPSLLVFIFQPECHAFHSLLNKVPRWIERIATSHKTWSILHGQRAFRYRQQMWRAKNNLDWEIQSSILFLPDMGFRLVYFAIQSYSHTLWRFESLGGHISGSLEQPLPSFSLNICFETSWLQSFTTCFPKAHSSKKSVCYFVLSNSWESSFRHVSDLQVWACIFYNNWWFSLALIWSWSLLSTCESLLSIFCSWEAWQEAHWDQMQLCIPHLLMPIKQSSKDYRLMKTQWIHGWTDFENGLLKRSSSLCSDTWELLIL